MILITDADGLTPNVRSAYSAWQWNHGKVNMFEFGGIKLPLTPYGKLTADVSKCTGCKTCIEVCPMGVIEFDITKNHIHVINAKNCVNCRACLNRCQFGVLKFIPETVKAQQSFDKYFSMKQSES